MIKIVYTRKSREERIIEIKRIARKVFLEKGLRDTTMEDIINETTLSKGGFYYYFKSTKEIYFSILEDKSTDIVNQLEKMTGNKEQTLGELVNYLIKSIFEDYDERRLFLMGMYEAYYDDVFLQKLNIIKSKYIDIIVNIIYENYSGVEKKRLKKKINFLYTVYHSFVMNCNIMDNKEIYRANQKYIKNLFLDILTEIK